MTSFASFPAAASSVPLLLDLASVDSTNSVLAQIPDAPPFSVVLASHQRAGRGRQSRQWISKPRESLALSIVLPVGFHKELPASWVPLVAALAMVETLREFGVLGVGMKWPNDILVADRKLGGVLCEMDARSVVIAGLGININFATSPPTPTSTSLSEHIVVERVTTDALVAKFVGRLRLLGALDGQTIMERVSTVMLTLGREVEVVESPQVAWRGSAESLDESGHLVVRHEEGGLSTVAAADVWHLRQ